MKKNLFSILLTLFFLVNLQAHAQIWEEYSSFHQGVGLQLGSSGIGIQGSYPLSEAFGIRAGANWMPSPTWNVRNKVFKVKRSNVEVMLDWQPLLGGESWWARKWIVSAGAGYFFDNKFIRYVGHTKVPDPVVDYEVEYSKFRPYIGTGLNNIRLAYHLNLGIQVGYFIPTKKVEIIPDARDPGDLEYLHSKVTKFPYNVVPGLQGQVGISYIFFK